MAAAGIVQAPFVPRTCLLKVSELPKGVDLSPTRNTGRVSKSRQGVIDTNDDAAESAWAYNTNPPPAPSVTATAAPMAAQRERTNDEPMNSPPNRTSTKPYVLVMKCKHIEVSQS